MLIFPAIDLKDGRCVRLRQGDMAAETVYSSDPVAVATEWWRQGAQVIHIVDLNGAVDGRPQNLSHIQAVVNSGGGKIQVGGGIRTMETIRQYLSEGVWRVVLGTAALQNPALLDQACAEYPGRIVLGLDAKDGKVAVRGWTTLSDTTAVELLRNLAGRSLGAVVYTDIARDGMLTGPNIPSLRQIVEQSAVPVIASGGISRVEDLRHIRALGSRIEGAIVGKALYDGKLSLPEALRVAQENATLPC